jgi:signal transduction histidine kinase
MSAALEVAIYRIASEALLNVVRHAQARTCTIRLDVCDQVRLEVIDDGIGMTSARHAGVGLRSMRERAAELGGTCDIGTGAHGGTRIVVELPRV